MAEVDVLVVAALQEEFDAAREVASAGTAADPGVARWEEHDQEPPPYQLGEYRLADGGSLLVALARPVDKGGTAAGAIAGPLAERLRPRCLAMSGVCAGNPAEVVLGDVIVASVTYRYQEGKQGIAGFRPGYRQIPAAESWIRAAQDLSLDGLSTYRTASGDEIRLWVLERLLAGEDPRAHRGRSRYIAARDWAGTLAGLESDGLITVPADRPELTDAGRDYILGERYRDVSPPCTLPYRVTVGPMASGDLVVKDGLTWDQLRAQGVETVAGLEMEAATIARTASTRDDLPWIIVKGVMDYADPRKDDRFKPFAARASAEVMFRLLATRLAPRERVRRPGPLRNVVTVSVIAAALLGTGGYALSQMRGDQGSTELSGSVVCESGKPVVGVWIASSAGQGASGFAHLGPPDVDGISRPIGSRGTYSYLMPHGGSYAVHVGCGGNAKKWASKFFSRLLSSPTVSLRCGASTSAQDTAADGVCLSAPAR
jgi:nucleoside phosphorylase